MKYKIFAQFLLLVSLVVSCSEVPVKVSGTASGDDELVNDVNTRVSKSINSTTEQFQNPPSFKGASSEQRTAFLHAEHLFLQHDDSAFLTQMEQLKDYPLYPYLQGKWLQKNLNQSTEIATFLTTYKNSRYADVLRQDWLALLAKNQQWSTFVRYYQADSDAKKTALQCHFAAALYNTAQQEQALMLAKELWISGTSQSACDAIFSVLQQSSLFTEELLWQRFSASLRSKKANIRLATQLKQQMSPSAQKTADVWLKIASHNLPSALAIWESQKASFNTNVETVDYVEQKLGLGFAAIGNSSNAYAHLIQVTNLDDKTKQTLIRLALREQNWSHVSAALSKLSPVEKDENQWRYWQARTWQETGSDNEARLLFTELSKKSDFYAFLAADKLKIPYQVVNIPVSVTEQELNALQQQADFKIITEWFALGRKEEATKQWWYTLKKLEPQQIKVAAKLAQRWQMLKLAAFTIAKAKYWQDLELRFPIAYHQEIYTHALQHNLDPALVFGLIRQESVFDAQAGSNVGARGLMQIMPATGRQIAKQLQEPWHSDQSLYEADTNIKYGSFYYKQLLDKFDGQVALAAAGYNAGPGRVSKWRPDKSMAMDVWIETIPFDETRQYVGMVLSNALFYQQRMNRDILKISDFMTEVQP